MLTQGRVQVDGDYRIGAYADDVVAFLRERLSSALEDADRGR